MMTTITAKGAALWVVVLLAALSIPSTLTAQTEDSHVKGTMILGPIENLGVPGGKLSMVAPEAAEDTLPACQARIQDVASAGQRMLAEQSCVGEETMRKAIRLAPRF